MACQLLPVSFERLHSPAASDGGRLTGVLFLPGAICVIPMGLTPSNR